MVTPELKDKILKTIIEESNDMYYFIPIDDFAEIFNYNYHPIIAFLNHFQELGLIKFNEPAGAVEIYIQISAFDLINRGGFVTTEELLKKNIEKLLLEIESLKPNMLDKVSTITTIASNILTGLGQFSQKL